MVRIKTRSSPRGTVWADPGRGPLKEAETVQGLKLDITATPVPTLLRWGPRESGPPLASPKTKSGLRLDP
eukprot:7065106-Pyramimonas_sp.AAC.1